MGAPGGAGSPNGTAGSILEVAPARLQEPVLAALGKVHWRPIQEGGAAWAPEPFALRD